MPSALVQACAMRILALEPYYGGSHQVFLDQWIQRSQHDWELLTLPAHHWKWRMRHAGIWFASQVRKRHEQGARWDALFCSDMLDLAQFRGLCPALAVPCVLYFHENQLTYPTRFAGERDLHFALTNFTSALAAQQVWFNSEFHRRAFLSAVRSWLRRMPDYAPVAELDQVKSRCQVQSPGIDVPQLANPAREGPLHIAWAARWEHDKNPHTFFEALRLLDQQQIPFQLTVCGQSFRQVPAQFGTARDMFRGQLRHWGPVGSRSDYLSTLSQCDVFASTALHEFFGLAVMESIALGLYPLLPRRLSYPELLQLPQHPEAERYFYDGTAQQLAARLRQLAESVDQLRDRPRDPVLQQAAQRYDWDRRAMAMDQALLQCSAQSP